MVIDKKTLNVPRPRRSFQIKGPQAGAAAATEMLQRFLLWGAGCCLALIPLRRLAKEQLLNTVQILRGVSLRSAGEVA